MRRPYMEDPYTELAGAIVRLREEIVEGHEVHLNLQRQLLELIEVVKALTTEIDAIHEVILDVR
jgi:hypothetical protein